jgi:hypothetical protein
MQAEKSAVFWLLPAIISLMFAGSSSAHDLIWPGEKLKNLFPQVETFEQKNLYVSDEQRSHIEKLQGSKLSEEDIRPSVYLAMVRNTPDSPPHKGAAIMFIDASGEGGKIEMGVVVNGKGEIAKVHLFENKESANMTQRAFLKQFEGKKASDPSFLSSHVRAESLHEKETVPYGDNCPLCGEYGYCSKPPTHEEAANALKSYFGKRGLNVMVLKQKDRFLEVEVYRNGTLVDRVLLDLRTGRIRSIY